ncbi:MAG: DMT family transporter [Pseudomonadota bacterium]
MRQAAGRKADQPLVGIALILCAWLAFSFIDTSAKWLALAGIASLQLAFMRYIGAFAISLAMLNRHGVDWDNFKSDRMFLVIVRGALLMGSTILNFFAVRYLSLTLTSTILFSAPIIITALAGPLLGERVGIWRWIAIIVGFGGILVAVQPFGATFHPAVFLSMAAALCFSFYAILTRKLSETESTATLQFYAGLVGTVTLLPFALLQWQNPANAMDWAIMIGLGFFGWFGHELLTRAHEYAPASTLTPYTYAFILYLAIWSALVFNDWPTWSTVLGASIVIGSGIFIWLRERKLERRKTLEAQASLIR